MAASTASGSINKVLLSTSTKTGFAPRNIARLGVETHVSDGVITSSPGAICNASNATCIPAVAEASATASPIPQYAANADSNAAHFAPVVIQPERNTFATSAISASLI